MGLSFNWSVQTDVGRQRDHNEDSNAVFAEEGIWLVADGMGGHNSGEVASRIAVEEVTRFLVEPALRDDPEVNRRLGSLEGDFPPPVRNLIQAVRYANERIFVEGLKSAELEGMGTTIIVAKQTGTHLLLGWVGDSRIYRLRQQSLEQLSIDHSLLNYLLQEGGLSREEAEKQAQGRGNVLVRALGLQDTVKVDVRGEKMVPGDLYVLCSDGLTDMVDDHTIGEILALGGGDLRTSCSRLVERANHNGGRDNITVCLLQVEESPSP